MVWATSCTRSTAVFTSTMAVITALTLTCTGRLVHRAQVATVAQRVGIVADLDGEVEQHPLTACAVGRARPRTVELDQPSAGRLEPAQHGLDLFRAGIRGRPNGNH